VARIDQGRIVFLSEGIPDPQGRNPKPNRPFLVLTPSDQVDQTGFVEVVSISSTFTYPLSDDLVILPYGRGCITRLSSPSVAVCGWRACISVNLIAKTGGHVGPAIMEQIVAKACAAGVTLVRDDRPPTG